MSSIELDDNEWTAEDLAGEVLRNYERSVPTMVKPETVEELLRTQQARAIVLDRIGYDATERAVQVIVSHGLVTDICERVVALEARK